MFLMQLIKVQLRNLGKMLYKLLKITGFRNKGTIRNDSASNSSFISKRSQ